jgi:hypothetical protein
MRRNIGLAQPWRGMTGSTFPDVYVRAHAADEHAGSEAPAKLKEEHPQ